MPIISKKVLCFSGKYAILVIAGCRMRYMERRGSGLRKIINETSKLPGYTDDLKPKFHSDTSFRVVIMNVNYHPNITDNGVLNGVVNGVVSGTENEGTNRREKVLVALKVNNKLTKAQLAKLLGIPKTTLDRDLAALKNDNKLTRIGSDKSGHWEIIDS